LNDLHEAKRRWVLLARILRPRGNKGEVVAELLTDFSSRFSTLKKIYLRKDNDEPRSVALENFWVDRNHPGMGVFHLAGCTTISEAEKLRGCDVLLPFGERVALPAGQFFVTDLIGCTVFALPADAAKLSSPPSAIEQAPQVLGTVRDVFFTGESVAGTPLLQVETPRGELLVPLAEDICTRIDVAERRIDVRLPEGMSDVNAPASDENDS
jgi:16S rRNA processing protein RimM